MVQRATLDRAHIATAFAGTLYIGIAISALLVLAAPLIGALYHIEESVGVLRALGAIFLLRGFCTVSFILCQRAMNFRAIAIVDAVSYALGSTVSVACALYGAGPWALVAGYLTEEVVQAALYIYLQPPPFALRIDRQCMRDLLGFSIGQTLIQVCSIFATYGDNFVVGRVRGAAALGYYTRAYDLIKLPSAIFANIVGNVLFPAFSRLQKDPDRIAAAFNRVMFANALVLLPASACLIVIAPEAIHVVMGDQWDSAVLPFRILAITMLMRTSYKVAAMVGTAVGAVYAVALANAVYMVVVIGGAAISIRWGIAGVAATTAIALLVVYLHCCAIALRVSQLPGRRLAAAHVPGVFLAILVAAAAAPAAFALRAAGAHPAITFAAVGLGSMAVAIAGLALYLRTTRSELAAWLRGELGRLRKKLRR